MKNDPERKERLLADVFAQDWNDGPAAELVRTAAAAVRRRRRRPALIALGVASFALAIGVLSPLRKPGRGTNLPEQRPAYELASDEELLAHLKVQPTLLIKHADGTAELRFLNLRAEGAADAAPPRHNS
jgi:hypothetical protein